MLDSGAVEFKLMYVSRLLPPMQQVLSQQTDRVLFGAGSNSMAASFPRIGVTYILCTKSVWFMMWAKKVTAEKLEDAIASGKVARPIKFVEVEDNHFVRRRAPDTLSNLH